jgi:AcrR family transcriptional regulator
MDSNEDHSGTELRILDAAKKVFIANGMAGARMQDIADEAGINKAMLHYYFRSKEKLFATIFRDAVRGFIPRVNAIFDNESLSLFGKIEQFCAVYIDQILESPFIPIFVLNEINRQPEQFFDRFFSEGLPHFDRIFMDIQKEVREGNIHPVHPLHLLMHIMGMCVFPFLARPIWRIMGQTDDTEFLKLMEARKTEIPAFIIRSLKTQES